MAFFCKPFARTQRFNLRQIFFVIERAVADAFPMLLPQIHTFATVNSAKVRLAGEPRVLEGGEGCENDPALIFSLQDELSRRGIDRHSYVAAIGGGAFQDAIGFAASICHRGVRQIRIPTTVLWQADSGVGVKNGINFLGKKNFLGTFVPPFAVINDARFLSSLPKRDVIAGMAEAVKVALIRDRAFFSG